MQKIIRKYVCFYDEGKGTEGNGTEGKSFTQDQVNTFLADARRKDTDKHKKQIGDMQEVITSLEAKGADTAQLKEQIETMKANLRTKDEQAEHEQQQERTQHATERETLTVDRDSWHDRFVDVSIDRSLVDAASNPELKVFNPQQLVMLLRPNTRLVDQLDETGKKTGSLAPVVTMTMIDIKTKESKEVQLAPSAMIKRMSEAPEQFGNLFKSDAKGGFGGSGNVSGAGAPDMSKVYLDPKAYRKMRQKGEIPD